MILYGTLALCSLGAAFLVYRHDLYDREPTWLLALAVGLGALLMAVAGQAESWAIEWSGRTGRGAIAAIVALVEESLKFLGVVALAIGCSRPIAPRASGAGPSTARDARSERLC